MAQHTTPAHWPSVSVIMPVYNEARFIRQSLTAVLEQRYPVDRLEVLIVDGMSRDSTRQMIDEVYAARQAQGPTFRVMVLDNPQRIVPTAMNIGIRQAQGEIVVRVDGHTLLEPEYVAQCVAALERTGAANVGGLMRAAGQGYVAEAIALATSTPFGIGNSAFHYAEREQTVDTVYLGAFRKAMLLQVGLFNEAMVRHQDYELNYRIRKAGGTILLCPAIRSRYFVRSSLRKLWSQYYQYGIWKGVLLTQHPDSVKWRHSVPPLLLAALVLGLVAAFWPGGGWLLGTIVALYGSFLLVGAGVAGRQSPRHLPILPIVLACLHLSYGSGIWHGVIASLARTRARVRGI